jgi:predicted nuclease of predicted toxin-antitoxin system
VKLLVDMNLSPHWVERLNAAGLPAVHWSSVGRMDAPDIEIMAHAAKYDYVVLTHDLDFSAILAATEGTKPSFVPELAAGALLTIDPGRTRPATRTVKVRSVRKLELAVESCIS